MVETDTGFRPQAGFLESFLHDAPVLNHTSLPHFDIKSFDPLIDFANMQPRYWHTIAKQIAYYDQQYDGFIMLHGTDTMAYTASALSFLLQNLTKPVILTGAKIQLCKLRTDGIKNIVNSLLIADYYPFAEVCIYFNNQLLRGNRATKHMLMHCVHLTLLIFLL